MKIMASQIKTFGMGRMTIGSASNFHGNVLGFINAVTAAALHVESFAPAYTSVAETLASIVNRQRAFVATAALKQADYTRDRAVGAICSVTNAYLTSPVKEKSEAAQLLRPQLSSYAGISNDEYSKQTSEVKGMLTMLDKAENKAAIATLSLTAEVEALRTANATFEAAFLSKTTEMSDRMEQSAIKSADVIAQANALYADIVRTVNAYAIVQPSDAITTFIDNVNGLVGVYSNIAGSRSSKPGTSGTDTPVTPPDSGGEVVSE